MSISWFGAKCVALKGVDLCTSCLLSSHARSVILCFLDALPPRASWPCSVVARPKWERKESEEFLSKASQAQDGCVAAGSGFGELGLHLAG